ncbi:hypothetical protein J0895_07200 [Phormidium pseudopriestleyi FRX01]|uniref:Uncharacterized protein n=1 Tax=Phormidium pseudopriestleyi FRX01 TaxID=1759528 RepID=A0ABS3FP41_9CYAN|nr:hypothetical protein [Phormidium pseudopriestleyi]MBO0348889.1 hypothetical protein [Phormidium pseudopriestleyi FRX01]
MIYLAQVQKKGFLGKTGLRLLACQKSGDIWGLVSETEPIVTTEANAFGEGILVLADITTGGQIRTINEATEWAINLIQQYLTKGLTPDFLDEQADEIEKWRQSLTLQSQELSRRSIELEARRDQLQALEEKLKKEERRLEILAHKLEESGDEHRAEKGEMRQDKMGK